MSGRFSRGRRYSRSRSYKSYPKRSSLIRRSMGNMRAAKRQNDLSNTTLSGSTLSYVIPVGANRDFGYQTFNIWNALNESPMFSTLRQCYDQMRINNIKVKFSLLQATTMSGTNCPVFATVWDRNGFHPDQYEAGTLDYMNGTNLNWGWQTFASYSSFEKRSMSSGSAFNATLSISPSNMAEKSMYVSTMDVFTPDSDGADSSQICSPLSNPALPFKPQIVTGIYTTRLSAMQNFIMSVDWEIDATFRGMHASKGQVVPPPIVDRISHVIFSNQTPYAQQNMDDASPLSSILTKATSTGSVTMPSATGALCIEYQAPVDLWKVNFVRNTDSTVHLLTVNKGGYFINNIDPAMRVHFGKGDTADDPILFSGAIDSDEPAERLDAFNVYLSAKVFDFVCE